MQKKPIAKEMLISIGADEHRIAIVENGVLEEFFVEKVAEQRSAGNMYKGRVETVLPGLGAAFVDIGGSKKGFLYIDERGGFEDIETIMGGERKKSTALTKGQEVLVQVVREGIGTKGPRLTRRISIPGRFLVLMPHEHHIGISKRIGQGDERARIKQMLSRLRIPKDMGFIVRTEAEGVGTRELARELRYLANLWRKIVSRAQANPAPSLIYEEYDLVLRVTRDLFSKEIDRILVDSRQEFRRIYNFIRSFLPALRRRVRFYRGGRPLFEKAGIEKQIEIVFSRRIQLKSGGHIVIEPTEALVAIDVNTGQFTGSSRSGKEDPEQTAFVTNREAAREIARQIRLKDLGGIIVIDFIDMRRGEHVRTILNELREGVRRDKAKIKILQFSHIGLVEMTRQRIRKGIESTLYHTCPYCGGRGLVKG
jgi:ribonuclease G